MSKELIAATVRELEDWPGTSMVEEPAGKHCKLVLSFNNQSRLVVVSKTPSDHRALPNHLTVVRRELRSMGAAKAHPVVGSKASPAPKPTLPAKHNPFVQLETIMKPSNKIEAIFKAIEDLRYSEMLQFSGILSDAACAANMKRSDVHGWAKMLQSASEEMSK